jgi:hypothetical protein
MAHENSWLHRAWAGWHREFVRGALLFGVVVAIGLFVVGQVRAFNPLALMREGGFDFRDHGGRSWVEGGRFAGVIRAGETLWIRNVNGQVTVEPTAGDSFEVVAEKSARRSDLESVTITMVPSAGDGGSVTICAMWPGRDASCGADGHYKTGGVKHNDVAVRFHIRLPQAVKLDASTVNGAVEVAGVHSPLTLQTVNGAIELATAAGAVDAQTVNGSISASVAALADEGVALKTVNGSITASVPSGLDATLEASTVNGRVSSDLPLQVTGKISPRSLRAIIGDGGAPLRLRTVNGSVTIAALGTEPALAPVPPRPPDPPARPRVRVERRAPVP